MEEEITKSYDDVINELSETWKVTDLLNFNEINIQEKLMENSSQIWHFTELYHREKNDYDKILEMKDKLIAERYNHYKTKGDQLLKQGEIEKYYLPKDPVIMKITRIAREQKWRVDFYDGLRRSLEKMQWTMKTYLDSVRSGL